MDSSTSIQTLSSVGVPGVLTSKALGQNSIFVTEKVVPH
jgi:hypothetical protein